MSARLALRAGSATRIPLPDCSADVVLCHQVLHHLIPQADALAEVRRVLRPGGLLLLSESCRCFIERLPVRLLFRHPAQSQRGAQGYVELVRGSGFLVGDSDIVTVSPWWSLPDFGLWRRMRRQSRVPDDSTEVLLVAEKRQ